MPSHAARSILLPRGFRVSTRHIETFPPKPNRDGAPTNGLHGRQSSQLGSRIFIRFVAEMAEAASHGPPFTADTLRLFSSAAPTSRHGSQFAEMRRQAMNEKTPIKGRSDWKRLVGELPGIADRNLAVNRPPWPPSPSRAALGEARQTGSTPGPVGFRLGPGSQGRCGRRGCGCRLARCGAPGSRPLGLVRARPAACRLLGHRGLLPAGGACAPCSALGRGLALRSQRAFGGLLGRGRPCLPGGTAVCSGLNLGPACRPVELGRSGHPGSGMMRDAKEWLEWRAVSPIRFQDFHEIRGGSHRVRL